MAESAQESESAVNDSMVESLTSLPSESEFSAVIFHSVQECYAPDRDIECRYTIKPSVKPSSRDWIGMFKVGWHTSREHFTYEWSPVPAIQDGGQERPVANRVVFRQRYLPKADEEFYQFCYVTSAGDVRGASVPFEIKIKSIEPELECCEIEDEDLEGSSIMMVKNKTAMLEESLGRVLEEVSVLKVSKEKLEADLSSANERVMELETRKAELTSNLRDLERKSATQENALAQQKMALEEEQTKRKGLEDKVAELETTKENQNSMLENSGRRVDELVKIVEQGRTQSTEVEKNREKLAVEQKQYLARMTADREMLDKLQSDLKTKEDEGSALKGRLIEMRSKAKTESAEFAEKMEKANSATVKLQEQLAIVTDENTALKRNMEEESDRLNTKAREIHVELKNKDQKLQKAKEDCASLKQKCEELENLKEQILKDASLEAELLGKKIEDLQEELNQKQDMFHRMEYELEDLRTQLANEKGKSTALEEDYESVVRALEDQLDGEKALNRSLCSQSDRNLADVQAQVQKQLAANTELSHQLEARTAEIRGLYEELDNKKKQLQASEEKVQKAWTQLTSADTEVRSLKMEKESLQMSLTNTQGANAKSSKNSAASMYALQTAHAHLEKKYLSVKKELDSLWRERNELKRTVAAFQGSVSADDLRLQIEELRARNEDLRVRLNMGAEAYKMKFIECRKLESQMKKLCRSTSTESLESSGASDVQSVVSKLRKALDEEKELVAVTKKALSLEKNSVIQKNKEINQYKLDIAELRQKVEDVEQVEMQKAEARGHSKAEALRQEVVTLKESLEVEKFEKEGVIQEIVNLQEILEEKDMEKDKNARHLEALRETLSREQADREALGEQARQRIKQLEESERELDLKVKQLNGEIERWKCEVDLHVEAEAARLKENKPEEPQPPTQSPPPSPLQQQQPPPLQTPPLQPTPIQAQPSFNPSAQPPYPMHGIRWPFGNSQHPPMVPPGLRQPQPWVWIQHSPEAGASPVEGPHTVNSAEPQVPSAPAPEPPVTQCPVCMALLPPSVDRDEHVNGHFD